MLEAERVRAAAVDAALDLVAHEQRAALGRKPADGLQKFRRARMHAALALHALHHDGAHLVALGFEPVSYTHLDVYKRQP